MERWSECEKYLNDALRMWDKALKSVYNQNNFPLTGEMELVGGPLDGRIVPNREKWVRGVTPPYDDKDQRLIVDEYERLDTKPVAIYVGRRRVKHGEI